MHVAQSPHRIAALIPAPRGERFRAKAGVVVRTAALIPAPRRERFVSAVLADMTNAALIPAPRRERFLTDISMDALKYGFNPRSPQGAIRIKKGKKSMQL